MVDGKRFYVLCSPGSVEGALAYGKMSDEHRFGRAWWAGSKYEFYLHRIDENRRVYRCHKEELKVAIPSPSAVGDFVWTWYGECLITQGVLDVFHKSHLTGYIVRPLASVKFKRESKRKRATETPPLWELEVYGDGGPPHPESGSIRLTEPDDKGVSKYSSWKNGLLVNEGAWDGSDFFTLDGWRGYIIVSERVKDLIVIRRYSNCALVRVEDMRWPFSVETPEEMLRRSQLDEKLKAEGLETEAESSLRELKRMSAPVQTVVRPRQPLLSKVERMRLRREIRNSQRQSAAED